MVFTLRHKGWAVHVLHRDERGFVKRLVQIMQANNVRMRPSPTLLPERNASESGMRSLVHSKMFRGTKVANFKDLVASDQ